MEQSKLYIPKPSEMMRANRPYLYSDSENTDAYPLSRSELSHQLDSLTDRNQHKDFEIFARKVCEREICPNLRPQTGPEGGGDGKVDTETYPVNIRISERWLIGDGMGGQDKWAFAFSAKKGWSGKVRSDVNEIVGTDRGYERIFFVTSRPTRAKDRLRIEDELKKQLGVAVTILDREWLIDRTFSHNHKDLAFNHLGAGAHDPDSVKLGPNDFRHQQALDEIESRLQQLGDKRSDQTQMVSDSFEAASLSRRLERPRYETEGRFQRATTFAKKYGANNQLLRAVYEHAWTRFWWFDDVEGMQELYEQVEEIAFATGHADHISKVCNLLQVIFGRVLNGHETADAVSLEIRASRLKSKLSGLATDKSRPNNALYAETLLLLHALNERAFEGERDDFDDIWQGLCNVVDRANGLGEYPADLLDSMMEVLSLFAPDSTAFDTLVEKLAEFMAERDKELKAGQIYVKQGERKLDSEKPIDAIKWLGRAVVNFMKEESREEHFQALYSLSVAYRGAGLLWAARGAALAAIFQASALSDQEAEIRVEVIPSFSLFTMVSMQLGHVADFLSGIQFLHAANRLLPLDDESRIRLNDKLAEFDRLFACLLVDLPFGQLHRLTELPDILDQLHLFTSRSALLYRLGHLDVLRDDGSIPEGTANQEFHDMMSMMAAQPACRDLPKEIVLLDDEFSSVKTTIMGVDVRISATADLQGILFAEAHVSFLEAFISTLLNSGSIPHRESLNVRIEQSADVSESSAGFVDDGGVLSVLIPAAWDLTKVNHHAQFIEHLVEFGSNALGHTLMVPNLSETFEELIGIERALDRATFFCLSGVSRHRSLGGYAGQLSDWNHWIGRSYVPLENAPEVSRPAQLNNSDSEPPPVDPFGELNNHNDLTVSSIINQDLWSVAGWEGMAFGFPAEGGPPILGLIFGREDKGRAIFNEWRERFGKQDSNDEIRLTAVKGIDRSNPFHYRVCVYRDLDALSKDERRQFVIVSRMTTMTVNDHRNLETFLGGLAMYGYYILVPVVFGKDGQPEFILEHAILKRKFHVRDAWQIGSQDVDAMVVNPEDDVIIPEGEKNPPIHELFEWRRQMEADRGNQWSASGRQRN